jgi:hypothetical protein
MDFAHALRQLANLLATSDPHSSKVVAVRDFASIFDIAPAATVASLLKRLSARPLDLAAGSPSLSDVASVLEALQTFLGGHAKAGILADLKLAEDLLRVNARAGVSALVEYAPGALTSPVRAKPAPLREDLVEQYLQRLQDARSDDPRFMNVYNELASNPDIGKFEAAALAKRFAGSPATARAAALKKLLNHHRALMTFRAKAESRDGRSAA